MPNEITNHGLDDWLEEHENGFTVSQRRKINKAGSDVYEHALQAFLNQHRSTRNLGADEQHLADTLTHEIANDGHYEVGFSKKGKKAYIARLLNDGWDSRNQFNRHGAPYRHVEPPEWHDFIARIGKDRDKDMAQAMVSKAKKVMRPKGL